MTHTPTPWKIVRNPGVDIQDINGQSLVYGASEDNAALIVRACNSHEELVRALRAALKELNPNAEGSMHKQTAYGIAKQALAKAEAQ